MPSVRRTFVDALTMGAGGSVNVPKLIRLLAPAGVFGLNAVHGVVVFISAFLLGATFTLLLVGLDPFEGGVAAFLANALLASIGLAVPVAPGVVAYSAGMAVAASSADLKRIRWVAFALAPVVPATAMLLRIIGAGAFRAFLPATIVAVLALGLSAGQLNSWALAHGAGQVSLRNKPPLDVDAGPSSAGQ
jgi:hypothetical protein